MTEVRADFARTVVAILLSALVGCGPNRAQVMGNAAQSEAKTATAPIGSEDEVRSEAGQGALILTRLSAAIAANPPKGQQQAAISFVREAAEIADGLRAIATSKSSAEFTNAVFGMCDPARKDAAPHVGVFLVALAGNVQAHPPANMTPIQQERAISYFATFGQRMIRVPEECDQAASTMAEASAEEQKAESEHAQNVSTAINAAALVFAGTVLFATAVGTAAATRPPVQNNTFINYGN
jgi:hypothetical protein